MIAPIADTVTRNVDAPPAREASTGQSGVRAEVAPGDARNTTTPETYTIQATGATVPVPLGADGWMLLGMGMGALTAAGMAADEMIDRLKLREEDFRALAVSPHEVPVGQFILLLTAVRDMRDRATNPGVLRVLARIRSAAQSAVALGLAATGDFPFLFGGAREQEMHRRRLQRFFARYQRTAAS